MIRAIRYLSIVFFSALSLPLFAAPEKLVIDDQHSYVLWRIQHLGFSTQSGKWYVKGSLLLDKDNPQNSKVEATIDVANFVTGIPELDKHLGDKLFFDVKQYPTAQFVSDKVELTGKNTAKVTGTLTVRGVSKPVTLDVTLNKVGKNPVSERMTVGFTATTTLKRSDFGLKAFLPDLGDEVSIEIGAEAYQPSA
ncbi:hypothetical protein GH742_08045 [Legionella sp. MW5194]|uniref:YceI family protein n=1 Tax=Legionella sp. MW5194 TaxID=2662448 RepID=UPI00193EAEA6|nr:YceI family protein [Legionella sp. MW5194]QRN03829.1 hypothetical protein GH742_08045 [Legionella sp. MW5194]